MTAGPGGVDRLVGAHLVSVAFLCRGLEIVRCAGFLGLTFFSFFFSKSLGMRFCKR